MNSGYNDMRYKVYIWGFPYLDYYFDVLISGSVIWAYITSFITLIYSLPHCMLLYACAHDTILNSFFLTRIYQYTCACLCMPLGSRLTTRWGVLTPAVLYVHILELGLWWTSWWSELRSDSVVDQLLTVLSPFLSGPLLVSQVFLLYVVRHFCTVHICTSLSIFTFVPISDVIFL